ncbi:MAG: VOC family protein [Sandaracinaceae bacterium]|nr:VOC family protein [Sandaracinaceae bacterium]
MTPFHLAFPVSDLAATERFYVDVLGCRVGRRAERWIDFDLRGHQISAHLIDGDVAGPDANEVDGDSVPVRHFGLVLEWDEWVRTCERLESLGVRPFIGPRVRFEGEPGEQGTLFVRDPSGNAIELKSFKDMGKLFAR